MSNRYEAYIASEAWRRKRQAVLERDNYQCQTCLATECLEVHHKTYRALGDEPLEDLITLCKDCHRAITTSIRERRYHKRAAFTSEGIQNSIPQIQPKTRDVVFAVGGNLSNIPKPKGHDYGTPNFDIQTQERRPDIASLWATGRPDEQMGKRNEED